MLPIALLLSLVTNPSVGADDGLLPARRRWAMSCVLPALALRSLDSAIAKIALPMIARAATAPLAGRLMGRYAADTMASISFMVLAIGLTLMATLPAAPSYSEYHMGIDRLRYRVRPFSDPQ